MQISIYKSCNWNIFYIYIRLFINIYTYLLPSFTYLLPFVTLHLYIFSYILNSCIENFYFCKYTYLHLFTDIYICIHLYTYMGRFTSSETELCPKFSALKRLYTRPKFWINPSSFEDHLAFG